MYKYITENDYSCWQQVKRDNIQALGYLYTTYTDQLLMAAMQMTDNRELAKDALQDVFIEIWHYRKGIGEISRSYSYLVKVLKSIILKKIKKNQPGQKLAKSIINQRDLNIEEEIINVDLEREKRYKLSRALMQLTNRQKEVVKLHYYDGLTYEQIAEKLSINYQSVNNLAFRAIVSLRKQM